MADIYVSLPRTQIGRFTDYLKRTRNRGGVNSTRIGGQSFVEVEGSDYAFTKVKVNVDGYFIPNNISVRHGDVYRSLDTGEVVGKTPNRRAARFVIGNSDGGFERYDPSGLPKQVRLMLDRAIELSEVGHKNKAKIERTRVYNVSDALSVLESLLQQFPYHKSAKNHSGGHYAVNTGEAVAQVMGANRINGDSKMLEYWVDSTSVGFAKEQYQHTDVTKRVLNCDSLSPILKERFEKIISKEFCEFDDLDVLASAIEVSLTGGAFCLQNGGIPSVKGLVGFDGESYSGGGVYLGCDVTTKTTSGGAGFEYIVHIMSKDGALIDLKSKSSFKKADLINAFANGGQFEFNGGLVKHRQAPDLSRFKNISIPSRTEVFVKPSQVRLDNSGAAPDKNIMPMGNRVSIRA